MSNLIYCKLIIHYNTNIDIKCRTYNKNVILTFKGIITLLSEVSLATFSVLASPACPDLSGILGIPNGQINKYLKIIGLSKKF